MKTRKIAMIGHYAKGVDLNDGQTVKTRMTHRALVDKYGEESVKLFDTYRLSHNPLRAFFICIASTTGYSDLVILPARNGLKTLALPLAVMSRLTGVKIHYLTIGGWLADVLKKNRVLMWSASKFNIYPETQTAASALESIGISSVKVIPNFKYLTRINTPIKPNASIPMTVCTFSRVMKKKGIIDAMEAIDNINNKSGAIKYELDIYGRVEDEFKDEFSSALDRYSKSSRYMGEAKPEDSVSILSKYYLLLFPTHFYTEGVPGTIIDAFFAGLPVIASKWGSFGDILDNDTAFGYDIDDDQGLERCLIDALDVHKVNLMRNSCIDRSRLFLPEKAMKPLFNSIGQ